MDLVSVSAGRYTVFPATIVEQAVFSPLYVFDALVKNQVGVAVGIHSRSSIPFFSSSNLLLCQYHAVFIVMAL
jgi:hypothetical protein